MLSHDIPSNLPPDRGVHHEIDLVLGTIYCVTRKLPLPKEQCDVIDEFFRAKHESGMVQEIKSLHFTPTICVVKRMASGALCMLIKRLLQLLYRHIHQFFKIIFFRTTWQDVQCTVHSTWSISIINCSCEQVISRSQRLVIQAVCFGNGWLFPRGFLMPPDTWNRLVTQLFGTHRAYVQTYFDDIYVFLSVQNRVGQT